MSSSNQSEVSKWSPKKVAFWLRLLGLGPSVYSSTLLQCFTFARETARVGGEKQCTNLHVLLALMHSNPGIAHRILHHLKCCDEKAIDAVTKLTHFHQHRQPQKSATFSRETKIALALAGRVAKRRKENYVGTQHVLFAMAQRNNSTASFLMEHGINENAIAETEKYMGEAGELID